MPKFTLRLAAVGVEDENGIRQTSGHLCIEVEAENYKDALKVGGERLSRAVQLIQWATPPPPPGPYKTSYQRILESEIPGSSEK